MSESWLVSTGTALVHYCDWTDLHSLSQNRNSTVVADGVLGKVAELQLDGGRAVCCKRRGIAGVVSRKRAIAAKVQVVAVTVADRFNQLW